MFKALADPARVKIMSMLLNADEVCACDASAGIGRRAATTSHRLEALRERLVAPSNGAPGCTTAPSRAAARGPGALALNP